LLFLVSSAVFVVVACNRTQPPPSSSFRPTSTIKDLMDSLVVDRPHTAPIKLKTVI
jgi:hypothetical protein